MNESRASILVEWNFVGDYPAFESDLRQLQPKVLIGINDSNDFTYSRLIHDATPRTLIFHRFEYEFENRPWKVYETPEEHMEALTAGMPDFIGVYLFNEPDMSGSADTDKTIKWIEGQIEWCIAHNRRAVVLNNSVGTWRRALLFKFRRIFQLCGLNPTLIFLGTHEYAQNLTTIDTSSPANPHSVLDLFDPVMCQRDRWTTHVDFITYTDSNDWIGRYLWVNEFCAEQQPPIPAPVKIVSEWGLDLMPDLDAELQDRIDAYSGNAKDGTSGFPTMFHFYSKTFPGQLHEQIVFDQHVHADDVLYTDDVYAFCTFIHSHNTKWRDYNTANMRTLMNLLIARAIAKRTPVTMPEETFPEYPASTDTGWRDALVYNPQGKGFNLREHPTTNSAILRTLIVPTRVEVNPAHEYKGWLPVRFMIAGVLFKGYVSKSVITIIVIQTADSEFVTSVVVALRSVSRQLGEQSTQIANLANSIAGYKPD